ncbi:AAA family ATPase [Cetobacterium sp.]|uniref:AAA family ATPase n=1 Tax=Cetobacterium sp. TaxID=2071632 RepID=UPI003F355810
MNKSTALNIFTNLKELLNLEEFNFDILAIKKLAKTNTLSEKNGNQTHIAITGEQIDIFPYLDNYHYLKQGELEFKKRFLLRIPICLSENNLKYLNNETILSKDTYIKTLVHFNHSKRNDGSIQGELSYLKKEESIFLDSFRKKLKENDYLIIIKEKDNYNYLFLGLKNSDMLEILNKYKGELKKIDSEVFYDKVNPGTSLNVTAIDLSQIREFQDLLKDFKTSDKLDIIGLYMAKLNEKAYKSFSCDSWNELYEFFGKKLERNPNSLKNRRDTFDPYFDNARVGHKKELYSKQKNILEIFKDFDDTIFTELILYILSEYEKSSVEDEINKEESTNLLNHTFGYQRIIYGAPGTGKSTQLKKEIKHNFPIKNCERVTFYDGYTYGQFVGSYKPLVNKKSNDEKEITYEYVPGPLIKQIVNAYKNNDENYVLVIEEINRARADKVFGDIFQLLDRKLSGNSEYPITPSEELERYLKITLGEEVYQEKLVNSGGLFLPNNLYIWATMNSADQGVYPMDTAFKRRWDFEYILLNKNMDNFGEKGFEYIIPLYKTEESSSNIDHYEFVKWNDFREVINNILLNEVGVSEDRLLAPFFIKSNNFTEKDEENGNTFFIDSKVYKSKVLMYLFEDILRHRGKDKIFNKEIKSFSQLIERYDSKENIFNENITEQFLSKYEDNE